MATGGMTITVRSRVRRLWLLRLAARTRSRRLVRWAARHGWVDMKVDGKPWERAVTFDQYLREQGVL